MLEKLRPQFPETTVAQLAVTLADARDTLRNVNTFLEGATAEHTHTMGVLRSQLYTATAAHERAMSQVEHAAIVIGGTVLGVLLGVLLITRKRRA
jgi:uncharacterized protein YaaN involved in tellurite resistance